MKNSTWKSLLGTALVLGATGVYKVSKALGDANPHCPECQGTDVYDRQLMPVTSYFKIDPKTGKSVHIKRGKAFGQKPAGKPTIDKTGKKYPECQGINW